MRRKTVPIMALVREFQRMRAGEISEQEFQDYSLNTKFTEVEEMKALAAAQFPREIAGAIAAFLGAIAGLEAASRKRSKRAVAAIESTSRASTKRRHPRKRLRSE